LIIPFIYRFCCGLKSSNYTEVYTQILTVASDSGGEDGMPRTKKPWYLPRPAAIGWCVFQSIAHLMFLFQYLFLAWSPLGEPAQCLTLTSDLIYYGLYAPLLWLTVTWDSTYWRKKGALLVKTQGQLEKINLNKIPYDDLVFQNVIGVGGFAEVYRALWHNSNVAVKKFKVNPSRNLIDNMLKESMLLAELKHPNILEFIGISSDTDNICIVTEFMSKGSLFDILHSQDTNRQADLKELKSWKLRKRIAMDIAQGVLYLHSHDPIVIHRDLKSHNVLLDSEWNAKLADFGISRIKEMTATMTQIGTPQWMAPEILRSDKYSEHVDAFSFGVIMWELATFKSPWESINPLRVVNLVAYEGVRLPIPATINIPPAWKNLMEKLWAETPSDRPTFLDILGHLSEIQLDE